MNKKVTFKNPKPVPENPDTWVNTREDNKRLTIDVPVSLHTKLKILSAKVQKTMSEIIKELLDEKLKD
jgi:macrodomain Ter protein organizer (MatP/YcbG family)